MSTGCKNRIQIKINKTKLLRLGIYKGEEVMFGKEKIIDETDNFVCQDSTIGKEGPGCFSELKKVGKMSLQTKSRILEATVSTVLKHGFFRRWIKIPEMFFRQYVYRKFWLSF